MTLRRDVTEVLRSVRLECEAIDRRCRNVHGDGKALLLLLYGRRLRVVLPESLRLFALYTDVIMIIAVVVATRNRIRVTRALLDSLANQEGLHPGCLLRVYACDDDSIDGTAELLESLPHVKVVRGDGSLYWGGAMHLAMTRAIEDKPDYILWANDDVTLFPSAIKSML
ncbi:MAG: glycosyltransferase, partial [Gammaproteobacteria bacterium]|nr:glycosyltransferase [Gammaproteobacteria bacterium]